MVHEAQQDQVGQAGGAAELPGADVVGGGTGGGVVGGPPAGAQSAAGPAAAPVPGGESAAQGGGLGAVATADVQRQAVLPADDRDLGPAGQGEDLAGGEHCSVFGAG